MNSPNNFWQGKRVRLRGVEPSDAEYFIRWNNDTERNQFLNFLWPPQSEASVRAFVAEASLKRLENDAYRWMIDNLAGETVGGISTHNCSPHDGNFSYGLDVAAEHRCRGYASEAILLVVRYYFHELRYHKCSVVVHSNNPASLRLHEKLGFVHEGTQRRVVYNQGSYHDAVWWGMTREEFDALYP